MMAFKLALITFKFNTLKELKYDHELDHDFTYSDPKPGESLQPMILEAFSVIRSCLAETISSTFLFCTSNNLRNVNNLLHLGSYTVQADIQHNDGTEGQTCTLVTVKFYRLDPKAEFEVCIDIEQLPSTGLSNQDPSAFSYGFQPQDLDELVRLLDEEFNLESNIECIPTIKRGRWGIPQFLSTNDSDRLVEYDFSQIYFHKLSQYQDVKVIESRQFGRSLLLNDSQLFTQYDKETFIRELIQPNRVDYRNKSVLILGLGNGLILTEILKLQPKFVQLVEPDEVVIEAYQKFCMQQEKSILDSMKSKYTIQNEELTTFLHDNMGSRFDIILSLQTKDPTCRKGHSSTAFEPGATQKGNLWHKLEPIIFMCIGCLRDDGVFLTAISKGKNDVAEFEDLLNSISANRQRLLRFDRESKSHFVPSRMEQMEFYFIENDPFIGGFN